MRVWIIGLLLALAATLTALFSLWLSNRADEPVPDFMPPEAVYHGIARVLSRPDHIVRVRESASGNDLEWTGEWWLDVPADRAQITHETPWGEDTLVYRALYRDGLVYRVSESSSGVGRPEPCPESDVLVLTLFRDCHFDRGEVDTTVLSTTFGGSPAIAIRSKGYLWGIDSKITLDDWLFVDKETFLPLARRTDHLDSLGDMRSVTMTVYEFEFVQRESVDADTFEPYLIGYSPEDQSEAVRSAAGAAPVYWLGESVPATATLPGLVLDDASVYLEQIETGGNWISISYRRADREFYSESVSIRQTYFNPPADDTTHREPPERIAWEEFHCNTEREVDLSLGRAVLHSWVTDSAADCDVTPANGFALEVEVGDSVVVISPSQYFPSMGAPDPYNGPEALISVGQFLSPVAP